MDAYAHRVAIGRRFGARIAAGDAVFLRGADAIAGLPCTVTDGESRQLGGMNRFMLMQVMQDQAWADPRFFTVAQVEREGWVLAPGAKKVGLQFFVSTGSDGLPLAAPESKRFHVFNASEIAGVPAFGGVARSPVADLETAAAAAGFAVGAGGLRAATGAWLSSFLGARAELAPAGAALRVELAEALLEVQAGLPRDGAQGGGFAKEWASGIDADPMSFFAAVKDAEVLAAEVMAQVKVVSVERISVEELASTRALLDGAAALEKSGVGMANAGFVRKAGATAKVEAMFAERAAVLAVRFEDRDRVKKLGAAWYAPQSLWFVPKGVDIAPFKEWNPRTQSLGVVATESVLIGDFTDAMVSLGLDTSKAIKADGKWHNVSVDSKTNNKNKSGSYILTLDGGKDGGAFGTILNKHTGETLPWKYEGALLTPEQRVKMRAEVLAREAMAEREAAVVRDVAAVHAGEIWDVGVPADGHAYVMRKGISADGLRQVPGSVLLRYPEFIGESGKSAIRARDHYLIVPMSNAAGELRAVQAISPDGAVKSFMRGGEKKGMMCVLGADSFAALGRGGAAAVGYVEGVATGASFRTGSEMPVVVCFDASNLEAVVATTSALLPADVVRVLAVDDDQFHVERALGFLSEKLGMNPHAPGGERIAVAKGAAGLRSMSIGEAVADGQWHQGARGSYCVTLHRDTGSEAVRSAVVEILPTGVGRKVSATFANRGVEAGRAAMGSIALDGAASPALAGVRAVMVMPEFKSLVGRPTDFNDLAKAEGVEAVRAVLVGAGLVVARVPLMSIEAAVHGERRAAGVSR